jgi:hypothetical protein
MTPRLALAATAALLVVAAGCSRTAGDSTGLARRTPDAEPLELTARVAPGEISPGDTALITVALTNRADTAVTLSVASGCQLHYRLFDAAGRELPKEGGGYACIAMITSLRLAPSETVTREFPWTAVEYRFPP